MKLKWKRGTDQSITHGDWKITVVGTDAGGRARTWGVVYKGMPITFKFRGGRSLDKTFNSQREAKEFVEWRISGVHPGEERGRAERKRRAEEEAKREQRERELSLSIGVQALRNLMRQGIVGREELLFVLKNG